MSYKSILFLPLAAAVVLLAGGCQFSTPINTARLIQHQAMVDPSGLNETTTVEQVKVHIASPQKWDDVRIKQNNFYTDAQWKSPSKMTGLGVAYVRMPIPLPARALVWFVKQEYVKHSGDDSGEMLGQWEDELGRPWFEARNSKYHVRGYCITKGFEAWIIYTGYKREQLPSAADLGVAARALETIVPTPFASDLPQRPIVQGNDAADRSHN